MYIIREKEFLDFLFDKKWISSKDEQISPMGQMIAYWKFLDYKEEKAKNVNSNIHNKDR